jgi:hypothetical protein
MMLVRVILLLCALFTYRFAEKSMSPDFLHDLRETKLAMSIAVIFQRNQDGCSVLPIGSFPVDDIADSLTYCPKGYVRHERVAMSDFRFVLVVLVVPSIDFDAARAGIQG